MIFFRFYTAADDEYSTYWDIWKSSFKSTQCTQLYNFPLSPVSFLYLFLPFLYLFLLFLPCYTFPKSFRRAVITVFEWRVCLPYVYCLLTKKSRKNAGHMIWFDFHMIWSHDSKTGVIFGLRWLLVLEARFGFFRRIYL